MAETLWDVTHLSELSGRSQRWLRYIASRAHLRLPKIKFHPKPKPQLTRKIYPEPWESLIQRFGSAAELARAIPVDPSHLSRLINGKSNVSEALKQTLCHLAEKHKVTLFKD
ncbi:MAG: hypothetical protein H6581_31735 [Bacteroidia bacterium]|nr:hypothetical protein [Bacteroidia bacterium]